MTAQKASRAAKSAMNEHDVDPLQLAQVLASLNGSLSGLQDAGFYQPPNTSSLKGTQSDDMESEDGGGDEDMGTRAGSSRRGSGRSDDKLRARRERNKLAARRCREKKLSQVQQLQKQLAQSVKENQILSERVNSLAFLYSKEHKLKEEFKSLLRAMPDSASRRYNGQSINEVIAAIEAGSLDVDRALTIMSATPAEAAAAEALAAAASLPFSMKRAESDACPRLGPISALLTAPTALPAAPASPSLATAAILSAAMMMSSCGSGGSSSSEACLDGLLDVCRMQGQPSCDAPAAPAN